jgi:ABC-type transporter Mla MlaB component
MSPGQDASDFAASEVNLDVSWLVPADLSAVDALARLHLTAARCGCSLHLHGAGGGLSELIDFCGLGEVLNVCGCTRRPAGERQ